MTVVTVQDQVVTFSLLLGVGLRGVQFHLLWMVPTLSKVVIHMEH